MLAFQLVPLKFQTRNLEFMAGVGFGAPQPIALVASGGWPEA
jgi:hypothetical protein